MPLSKLLDAEFVAIYIRIIKEIPDSELTDVEVGSGERATVLTKTMDFRLGDKKILGMLKMLLV